MDARAPRRNCRQSSASGALRPGVGAGRAPTWSPDGRLIAFVNRIGESYFVEFVDVRSGKPVERWHPEGGFEGADPSWDATGVYIPNA